MFRKHHPQPGARPGTLLIRPDASDTKIRCVRYCPQSAVDQELSSVAELPENLKAGEVIWIDIQGFRDEAALHEIAIRFKIHPLAMEDVVNVPQRSKAETYGEQMLIIARLIEISDDDEVHLSQLGIIVGSNYVITFEDKPNNRLDPVRNRIANPTARLRGSGAGYLAYALLDTTVDAAYPVLEVLGEQLESLEREVISDPRPALLQQVNLVRNRLVNVRRAVWPQRDAVQSLLVTDCKVIDDDIKIFLRDTYDHCVQTAEVVEMYREMASGLLNTYMSSVAHRSNEVMKVLTIMSSIFVPLTFVAGIYGMNFEHMPELSYAYSYPFVWGLMIATAFVMIWFFHKRGWIQVANLNEAKKSSQIKPSGNRNSEIQTRVLDHDHVPFSPQRAA
ncbi:MAG: magnesium/cobalt transporter CorA [Pirellulaceae bacterium]|nr:magnesium/cobalt transporter CorA [Pirellulaceae bacterium]